jgi:diguanylate cyclase (GGDEF)-like protein
MPLSDLDVRGRLEERRLHVLRQLQILDTAHERAFDDISTLAGRLFGAPMAAVTLVDTDRQWFKASVGLNVRETPRDVAFCDYTIRTSDPLVIEDALLDPRFAANPAVLGSPHVRFYAGVPIHVNGERIGALCVMDSVRRQMSPADIDALCALGRQVERLFELRWRRSLAAAPRIRDVETMAARVTSLADFARLLATETRPAWIYDCDTLRFLAVSERATEDYGWTRSEFLSMRLTDIRPAADRALVASAEKRDDLDSARERTGRHVRADGVTFQVQSTSAPVRLTATAARLEVITDLTTRLRGRTALVYAATHDSLTGLANRSHFHDSVTAMLADPSTKSLAILFIDLDGFKLVNDTAGHASGDAILASTAARMKEALREGDLPGRLGGDEFAVACPNATEAEAVEIAHRIGRVLQEPFHVAGRTYHLSVSTGVATAVAGGGAERVISDADSAMLAAKAAGRNQVAVLDDARRAFMAERSALEYDLRRAIEREEFEMWYQPIVEIDGPSIHLEALIRWHHPVRGLLAPGLFIPLAEESGTIESLQSWIMRDVAAMVGRLQQRGLDNRVAFNLPARLLNESFLSEMRAVIGSAGIEARQLIVEVTESAFAQNTSAGLVARRLRAMGAAVSIDDFGTGYSSLERLRELEVDALKLDQSFTRDVETPRGRDMVSGIVQLANSIRVPVVAEGVETIAQLHAVRDLGCRYAQGYLIARPAPEAQAVAFLRDWASLALEPGPHREHAAMIVGLR